MPNLCKNNNYKNKGFTIIELLVVIFIMITLTTLGFSSLRNFSRNRTVDYYANMVKSDLEYTRSLAISGQKPPNCPTQQVQAVFFHWKNANSYEIKVNCDTQNQPMKDYTFPNGVAHITWGTYDPGAWFVNVIPNHSVIFFPLGKGVYATQDIIITVTVTNVGNKDITITPSGEIFSGPVY